MGIRHGFPELSLDQEPLRVVRLLGEGAFAEVFLVKWKSQELALKLLKTDPPGDLETFKREFLLGKNLCHPVFVRYLRFGWAPSGHPFCTMEYLRGLEIRKLWPKLDSTSRKLLFYQLFLGLTLLHKKGLVHRDLKPSNLLVLRPNGAPVPLQLKIIDLGLAQTSDSPEKNRVGGTVDYLAPELIRRESADFRADFYAAGIILAEFFLGRPPFVNPDPAATLARHQESPLPELPIQNRKEKAFWQSLAGRLAAKNKEERPSSGSEVLAFLLEDARLRKSLSKHKELAADWCRTLMTRSWSLATAPTDGELWAETPATVRRGEEELADRRDVERQPKAPTVRLGIGNSGRDYPRLSESELEKWLSANFGGSRESVEVLWHKTSGEASLLESELDFWQKRGLLTWQGAAWKFETDKLKDIPLSSAGQLAYRELAATLPAEEQKLLTRLSLFLDFFCPEEVAETGLWPQKNLNSLLEGLRSSGFLISKEKGLAFSRPGLREALHYTLKDRVGSHRKIWTHFRQTGQTVEKNRAFEWEFQAAGAEEWEAAARQALAAAQTADSQENFKMELWYLNRALKWAGRMPSGAGRNRLLLDIHRDRGNFFGRQGELEKAIAEHQQRVRLAQKLKNRKEEALAYNRLGDSFRQLPDYPQAEIALKKAIGLLQKLGKELQLSHVHNNLGLVYAYQFRIEEALNHHTKAEEIQRRLGATKELASTLNNIGVAHVLADQLKESIQFFQEALELNRKLNEKEEMALCLNNLGYIQVLRGMFSEAERLFQEALNLNRQIGSQKWEVLNLDNLAIVAYQGGHHSQAIRYALLALELSEKINYQGNHLSILASLGGSLKAQGQYAEAEKYLTRGIDLAAEIHDLPNELLLYFEKAELYLLENNLPDAEKATQRAAGKIKTVSDSALRARLFLLSGKIAARKGNQSEAEKQFDEAAKLLEKSERLPERQKLALTRAEILGLEESGKKIGELLAGLRTLAAEPASQSATCEKLFIEAQYAFHSGDIKTAQNYASEALSLAYKLSEPERIWRLHHLLAKTYLEEKNYQKTFAELQSAAAVLEVLKENFDTDENLTRYFQDPEKIKLLSEIQKMAGILGK